MRQYNEYVLLTGNQLGALVLEYLLSTKQASGTLPNNGVVLKTIVTAELGTKIAHQYGVEVVNVLTGFKYIAEKIAEYEFTREKQFIFGITMQNHGGYRETYDNFTNTVRMTNRYYEDVNQYLTLANMTDRAVENLISYFEKQDEKVIICFFGDHQPSLQNAFYSTMNGKGLSGLSLEELEDLFTVPFFIWTNYETETEEVSCTSLNFLSSMMLERSGLPVPAYNRFLLDLQETVPALNARGYDSLTQGGYVHFADATGEEKEKLSDYQILEYNSMFDEKGRNEDLFPLLEEK